jgi:hypothetical protein
MAAVLLVSGCTGVDNLFIPPATFIGSTAISVDSTCGGPAQFYLCGCSSLASCSTHTGGKTLYTGSVSFQVSDLVGMYVISPNMDCSGTAGRVGVGRAVDIVGQSLSFTMPPKSGCPPAGPPGDPDPASLLAYILSAIYSWLQSILSQIFQQGTLAGPATATINMPQTYSVTLEVPAEDLAYADGSVERHYAVAFVADSVGNIIFNVPQEEVTGTAYAKTFSYTFTQPGSYAVGAVAVKTVSAYDFASSQWSGWSAPDVIASERMAISVTGAPDNPTPPNVDVLAALFTWIINLIRALFGMPPI